MSATNGSPTCPDVSHEWPAAFCVQIHWLPIDPQHCRLSELITHFDIHSPPQLCRPAPMTGHSSRPLRPCPFFYPSSISSTPINRLASTSCSGSTLRNTNWRGCSHVRRWSCTAAMLSTVYSSLNELQAILAGKESQLTSQYAAEAHRQALADDRKHTLDREMVIDSLVGLANAPC